MNRYYVEANGNITLQILFEEWFYCDNLDKLNDVIQRLKFELILLNFIYSNALSNH